MWTVMSQLPRIMLLLPILVLLVAPDTAEEDASLSSSSPWNIPGITQTDKGYDTELGTDAICWKSHGRKVMKSNETIVKFPNSLIEDFALEGRVELLSGCPIGNTLTATAPSEFSTVEHLITDSWYNFHVTVHLNLTSLIAPDVKSPAYVVSDQGPVISLQVLACLLGKTGFCCPFVDGEAIARTAQEKQQTGGNSIDDNNQVPGNVHRGSHVHSPNQFVRLEPSSGFLYNFPATLPMRVNEPGDFFLIVTMQMFVGESTNMSTSITRYDVSNTLLLDQRVIAFKQAAVILEVDKSILIVSFVAIGATSLVIIVLLVQTVKHRKHIALQLTQGDFLVAFLTAALVATTFCFLLEPRNDIYCQASAPVVVTSLHILFAVVVGRLWRVSTVVSHLSMPSVVFNDLDTSTSWWKRAFCTVGKASSYFGGITNLSRSKALRQKVGKRELTAFVLVLVAPQIMLQILSASLQKQERTIEYNTDGTRGRPRCDSGISPQKSLKTYGFFSYIFLVVSLLLMAHNTRTLPSLFNEARLIGETALSTVVLLFVCFAVKFVSDDPSTSPTVDYLLWVCLTLTITLNTSLRIMLPKLRLIWSDHEIVMAQIIGEHTKSLRQKQLDKERRMLQRTVKSVSSSQRSSIQSNLFPEQSLDDSSSLIFQKSFDSRRNVVVSGLANTFVSPKIDPRSMARTNESTRFEAHNSALKADRELGGYQHLSIVPTSMTHRSNMQPNLCSSRIDEITSSTVSAASTTTGGTMPSSSTDPVVLSQMLQLQNMLTEANQMALSGGEITSADWRSLHRLCQFLNESIVDNRIVDMRSDDSSIDNNSTFVSASQTT